MTLARTARPRNITTAAEKMENLTIYIKKQRILLRGAMIKPREIKVPLSNHRFVISLSELSGHGAFLFLALSYSTTDLLSLRIFAASGISLSIIFQYFRDRPLWIPIRWNSLFLLINAVMIGVLVKETLESYMIPEEQEKLYKSFFESKGMDVIDYMRLIGAAERREVKKGVKLITQGRHHDEVYFILSGSCTVSKNNVQVANLKPNNFIGEMAFVRYISKLKEHDDDVHHVDKDSIDAIRIGSADVIADEDSVVYSWSHDTLHAILEQYKSLSMVFEHILSVELNLKVTAQTANVAQDGQKKSLNRYSLILMGALLKGEVTAQERVALADIRKSSSISDNDHAILLSQLGWTVQEFEGGKKGVEGVVGEVVGEVVGGGEICGCCSSD